MSSSLPDCPSECAGLAYVYVPYRKILQSEEKERKEGRIYFLQTFKIIKFIIKRTCSISPSRVVPHRSTTDTRGSLTSLFGWEAVTLPDVAARKHRGSTVNIYTLKTTSSPGTSCFPPSHLLGKIKVTRFQMERFELVCF